MEVIAFLTSYYEGEIEYHDILAKDNGYKLVRIYIDGDYEGETLAEGLGKSLQCMINNELDYFFKVANGKQKISLEYSIGKFIVIRKAIEDFIKTTNIAIGSYYTAINIDFLYGMDGLATIYVHDSYIETFENYVKSLKRQISNDKAVFLTNDYAVTQGESEFTVVKI